MKSFPVFLVLAFVMTFCGLENRFLPTNSTTTNTQQNSTSGVPAVGGGDTNIEYEKPQPTAAQTAILERAKDIAWDAQGLKWRVPANWRKMTEERNLFNWGSSDNAFLIVTISPMAADFPVEQSTKAFYDGAVTRKKNGEVESVRYLEIDGVKGIEFVEAVGDGKDSPRRQQWIAYRKYAGQTQMLNLMVSTKSANFDKHRDDFAAILYSTKIVHE